MQIGCFEPNTVLDIRPIMKVRRDFLLALFILFIIPVIGYWVLHKAADDRMDISANLQPKDSISFDLQVNYLDAEGFPQTSPLVDLPYLLKVIETRVNVLDQDQIDKIMYIINDRSDLAFLLYQPDLKHSSRNRVMGYHTVGSHDQLTSYGDVLLVDAFNRIIRVYDSEDEDLYSSLLEDISYAFPMVEYRIEKMSEDEKQE